MEKTTDQQTRTESKTQFVGQAKTCLRSGDYARALEVLRGAGADLSNDAELCELEKLAHDGVKRKAEADRLITESQELFAQQKSAEALQLLRQAYELDKNNALARAILANALVEHAQSIVETDWLEAEKLANQALALNRAHPTANTVLSLIVEQKKASSVEDWVSHARKLQSSGDLFAALAWVAEGLAVHPDDPKLVGIQDAIQRDQGARRRQARRRDLQDLRRMELEIGGAPDAGAKQALAERIQGIAAKYWTDGEMLSIANGLLHQLGLAPQEGSGASPKSKGAAVIFHVPRPGTAKPAVTAAMATPPVAGPPEKDPAAARVPASEVPVSTVSPVKASATAPEPQVTVTIAPAISIVDPTPAPAKKVAALPAQARPSKGSNATTLIIVSAAAILLVAGTFFITRRHYASPVAKTSSAAPAAPPIAAPAPTVSAPAASAPIETIPDQSLPAPALSSDRETGKVIPEARPPVAESGHNLGTLVVVAGQDNAKVFLNGKLQPQLTQSGQLQLPNLEFKEYVVQVAKSGFQDPPQQKIRIRKGETAKLTFNLQPQPSLASLTIQGGAPGTTVLIDQNPTGYIQSDGTFSVSNVNPGDHTVELRKERFKTRQVKKHFVAGTAISLSAADAALEAAPAELKISFTPADASVALVKGEHLTMVSSGVPLSLSPGTYTLTARTSDRFTRSSTFEVVGGQSMNMDLSLAPNGMSKWGDAGAWTHDKDSYIRKGGDFVLYGVVPTSGTFVFSAMPGKGHVLQWVVNFTDPRNYVLFQLDDNSFSRTVVLNGQKMDQVKVPDRGDKKSFRALHIRVSPTEIVHQIRHGDSWTVVDRWTQPGANLSLGKFGFYIPGNDEVVLTGFAHYADLNIR